MSSLNDREKAFESKFAHDAEMQFKAEARRNKILALWAAGLLDLEPDAISGYVVQVIRADMEEAGDEDVYRKLSGDLGSRVSEEDLRAKMLSAMTEAKAQLISEA